jgi:hypothetical protein
MHLVYRQVQATIEAALGRKEPPDMATTMSSGPLDELVGLHEELGIFKALDDVQTDRRRRGIEDSLLLRTTSVLPFLANPSLTAAAVNCLANRPFCSVWDGRRSKYALATTSAGATGNTGGSSRFLVARKPCGMAWNG